ncbi:MAG: 2-hydroxyacid dehydrogenase [Acidimicrobiales bacterium]
MAPRVLVTNEMPRAWLAVLERSGLELLLPPTGGLDYEMLVTTAPQADAIVSLLSDRIDARVLEAGASGQLRVVSNVAVGVDNIDLDSARSLGITVCNTPRVLDAATADLAMLLILSACRHSSEAEGVLRRGEWGGWALTGFLGKDLEQATLGLVGYGGIAQAVERRAAGFDMRVLHHARRPTGCPGYVATLSELLEASDVVSVHVPLTPATRGLIGTEEIRRIPRGGVLVNTARGGIVDEEALAGALEDRHLAGAGLDVFVGEPHLSPRLAASPNLMVVPHIGSATIGARRRMAELACEGVVEVLAGRRPSNAVGQR